MCIRTNSSYSPRRFTASSASTNRRFSERVSAVTFLRVYATVAPFPRSVPGAGVAQPPAGAQFVDGRAGRRQRSGVRRVVVDHGEVGAVGAAHQVQRTAVHGDPPGALPSASAGRAVGRRPDAAQPAAPVDLVEGHLLGGVAATVRHVSGVLVGVVPGGPGAAGSHGRGEHRRETRAQQSPRHLPSGSPGARPAALSRRGVARSLTATAAPDDHVVLLPRVGASVAVTVRRPPRSPPRGPSVWGPSVWGPSVRGAVPVGSRTEA